MSTRAKLWQATPAAPWVLRVLRGGKEQQVCSKPRTLAYVSMPCRHDTTRREPRGGGGLLTRKTALTYESLA